MRAQRFRGKQDAKTVSTGARAASGCLSGAERVLHVTGISGVQAAELELKRLSNRTRFILAVVAGQLQISGRKKAAVEAQLEAEGYDRMAPNRRKVTSRTCLTSIADKQANSRVSAGGRGRCLVGYVMMMGAAPDDNVCPNSTSVIYASHTICPYRMLVMRRKQPPPGRRRRSARTTTRRATRRVPPAPATITCCPCPSTA